MASVTKRGNSYRVTVSNGRRADGTQILETDTFTPDPGMTKKQIERALEQFKVDFERDVKSGQNVKGRKVTLKELAELFIQDNEPDENNLEEAPLSITTWSEYKRCLRQRIVPELGHLKIGNIIPKTLKDYARKMRQDGARKDGKPGGLSESTITKDIAIISTLLSYAVGEGLLPINPLIYAGKQSKGHKPKKEYKVNTLTIQQTQALLWAMDNPIEMVYPERIRKDRKGNTYTAKAYTQTWQLPLKWRAYFYLSLFVGNRRGENVSFKWTDINFDTGEINIDKSTAYVEKKIYHKGTKTNRSRTPVVPPVVLNILRQWKIKQMQIGMELGTYWQDYHGKDFDKNYVFTQENGKQMHPDSPYSQFKRIIRIYNEFAAPDEEHRIPDKTKPHDLRHTAASILIANNMDPRSVAGVLGHSNPSTTLNIYSYFFRSKNQEAASIMANTLTQEKQVR